MPSGRGRTRVKGQDGEKKRAMVTWWLAINQNQKNTSYEELKRRKVVAQGRPALKDLLPLCPLVREGDENTFVQEVDVRARGAYANSPRVARVSGIMWNLLSMEAGDLVVGIEGTTVRGIYELRENCWESYQYQEAYDYAQTIGPVKWIDWDVEVFGFTPTPPRQSVLGVRRLRSESREVAAAWSRYMDRV